MVGKTYLLQILGVDRDRFVTYEWFADREEAERRAEQLAKAGVATGIGFYEKTKIIRPGPGFTIEKVS